MPLLKLTLDDRSPAEQTLRLSVGATLPELEVQVLDQNVPVDLSTGTVTFSMENSAGALKVTAAAGVLVDAAQGKIKYVWGSADVDTEGTFIGQFKIVIGSVQHLVPENTNQKLRIVIGPDVS